MARSSDKNNAYFSNVTQDVWPVWTKHFLFNDNVKTIRICYYGNYFDTNYVYSDMKKNPSIMLYVYTMDFKNIDLNYKEG